jgi:hypothetical protein
LILILGLCAWTLSTAAALADKRVALIIGNSNYTRVTRLINPENDASDLAERLRGLNFDVIFRTNADRPALDGALEEFERKAAGADTALFFFAGHGLQYHGLNYLLPVDANLEDEVSLRYNTLSLDKVREALDSASGVKIMILDACRNNPFSDMLASRQAGRGRGVERTRGLARIDQTEGMVVAYATQADQEAQDGQGRNSPFSAALVQRLGEPNLEIATLFRRVAQDVYEKTGGKQRPELSISLLQDFYLNLRDDDSRVWRRLADKSDVSEAELQDFIDKFPSSPYVRDAQSKLYVMQTLRTEREAIARQRAVLQAERDELERREQERLAAAKADKERQEREQAAIERLAVERREKDQAEAGLRESERLASEKQEQAKLQTAREAAAKRDHDQQEAKRLADEAAERDRLAAQQREQAQLEAKRLKEEAQEKTRQEAERLLSERKAAEAAARDESERKRLLAERQAAEQKEQLRIAAEQREMQKREAQRLADEKKEADLREKERIRTAALEAEARQKAEQEQARLKQAEVCARESADIGKLVASKQKDGLMALKPQIGCPGLVASIDKAVGDMLKAQQKACNDDEGAYNKIGKTDLQALKVFVVRAACDSVKAKASDRVAALETEAAQREAACTRDSERFASIPKDGDKAANLTALNQLQTSLSCEKLRPEITAAIKLASTEPVKLSNTPEQIKTAQIELKRVGCFDANPSGTLDRSTKAALGSYFTAKHVAAPSAVNDDLLAKLKGETVTVCKAEPNIATAPQEPATKKPSPGHSMASRHQDEGAELPSRRHPATERDTPAPKHARAAAPIYSEAPAASHAATPAPGPRADTISSPHIGGMGGI